MNSIVWDSKEVCKQEVSILAHMGQISGKAWIQRSKKEPGSWVEFALQISRNTSNCQETNYCCMLLTTTMKV